MSSLVDATGRLEFWFVGYLGAAHKAEAVNQVVVKWMAMAQEDKLVAQQYWFQISLQPLHGRSADVLARVANKWLSTYIISIIPGYYIVCC